MDGLAITSLSLEGEGGRGEWVGGGGEERKEIRLICSCKRAVEERKETIPEYNFAKSKPHVGVVVPARSH